MPSKQRGFTLIELLIVVAIIGIIAAIAIPNLMSAIQRAKQKRAMGEVRGIATALMSYNTDTSKFIAAGTSFQDTSAVPLISQELAPYYMRAVPHPDPWGSDYQYAVTADLQDFAVRCLAKDRAADTPDIPAILTVPPTRVKCFENDLVWVNGDFLVYPDGKQSKCS